MQSESANLFGALYRWVEKQDENYISESLAFVIRHMLLHCPPEGSRFLQHLTDGAVCVDPAEASGAVVTAQKVTEQNGTPDIWIELPTADVAVEVKVDAPLRAGQLDAYRRELDLQNKPSRSLVFLSRLPSGGESGRADVSIRWFQLAEILAQSMQSSSVDAGTQYLVGQFLEYLRFRMLALAPVRTAISQAVRQHYTENPDGGLLATRVRNLAHFNEHPALKPLQQLLALMRAAIQATRIDNAPILDSGQTPAPWIGYNINGLEYFLFVYLNKPEEVILETSVRFNAVPDIAEIGDVEGVFRRGKGSGLDCRCDLADPSGKFFALSSDEQLSLIATFVRESVDKLSRFQASA